MPIFYDELLGDEQNEVILNFIGSDNQDLLQQNLAKQPNNWHYRNIDINYKHNSYGHRCNNINEINFDNYILFAGCSHTYGVGLELINTYTYLTAKKLNCDYYNLSIPGTGIDCAFYNTMIWLDNFPKPKYVFFQFTENTRFLSTRINKKVFDFQCIPEGHWSQNEYVNNFVLNGDSIGYWDLRAKLMYNMLKNKFNKLQIQYKFITFTDRIRSLQNEKFIKPVLYDRARDVLHYGIKTHSDLANRLVV